MISVAKSLGHTSLAMTAIYYARPYAITYLPCLNHAKGRRRYTSFMVSGQVPESAIAVLIGQHPDRLVEDFSASRKPAECAWMNQSRITLIENVMGAVWVTLERA